jgi:hypothetical protein
VHDGSIKLFCVRHHDAVAAGWGERVTREVREAGHAGVLDDVIIIIMIIINITIITRTFLG